MEKEKNKEENIKVEGESIKRSSSKQNNDHVFMCNESCYIYVYKNEKKKIKKKIKTIKP